MQRHISNFLSYAGREWEGVILALMAIIGLAILVFWIVMIRGWGAPVPQAAAGRGADNSLFADSAFTFLDGGEAPRVPPNNCFYTTYFRPIPKLPPPPALDPDPIPVEIVDIDPIQIVIEDVPPIAVFTNEPVEIEPPPLEPEPEPIDLPPPPRHFVQYNGVMTSPSGEQLAIITYDIDDQGQNERKAFYLKEGRSVLGFRVRRYSRGMVVLEDPANEIDPFVIRLGQRLELGSSE